MIGIGRAVVRVPDDLILEKRTLKVPGSSELHKYSLHQGPSFFRIEGDQLIGEGDPGTYKITVRVGSNGGHYFAKRLEVVI